MAASKKLIEVALPLEAINAASAREKSIRHGHPSTLHLWWARRPLAAARAVIFAQMVDDPSAHPDLFPTEKKQEKERQRLFRIIEDLVKWENTTNEEVLERARAEIWQSWRYTCAENADHPRAKELFDRYKLPAFHDPFAGGGSLPLEAQRLGLEAHATDLNPVAVLINKAMIEIPPKFAGLPPVNPEARANKTLFERKWKGAEGLAEDVRYYGKWMRDEAEKRIGHLYPKVEITPEMAEDRPDLKPLVGQKLTVIAWLWARTVKSPNPAFADLDVPLASSFVLSAKPGQEAYVEPIIGSRAYRFTVRVGVTETPETVKSGTKLDGANFVCLLSGTPIPSDHIRAEGRAGRLGARLMAIVAEGDGGRLFLSPTPEHETAAAQASPEWAPDTEFFQQALGFRVGNYGFRRWSDFFTRRQLVLLDALCALAKEAGARAEEDFRAFSTTEQARDSEAYASAVRTLLALAIDKTAEGSSVQCTWSSLPSKLHVVSTFGRQALPMVWDYAEANVFASSSGNIERMSRLVSEVIDRLGPAAQAGIAAQRNAADFQLPAPAIISTDPPYYDNVGYSDLSDFFYVWLRRSVRDLYPELYATVATPKDDELVATPARHGGKSGAETFFLGGMREAMSRVAANALTGFPITVYYAFKQSESEGIDGSASTGWETFLEGLIQAGFVVSGTWPIRTERAGGFRNLGRNSLASSVVLSCRLRPSDAPLTSRRAFIETLRAELPPALAYLQHANIAPADLAQAAIGPGIAAYSSFAGVLDAEGSRVSVREALALINQALDEVLAAQEGDFDADSRWALAWFEQVGFAEGEFGVADVLARAKNTAVQGLVDAGIVAAGRGKVRLLKPGELPDDWDPTTDKRLTAWETVHHLVGVLEAGGEGAAAALAAKLGTKAEAARELCYRLYTICERKKRATEALAYNALVQSWPEIVRLAQASAPAPEPAGGARLFDEN